MSRGEERARARPTRVETRLAAVRLLARLGARHASIVLPDEPGPVPGQAGSRPRPASATPSLQIRGEGLLRGGLIPSFSARRAPGRSAPSCRAAPARRDPWASAGCQSRPAMPRRGGSSRPWRAADGRTTGRPIGQRLREGSA